MKRRDILKQAGLAAGAALIATNPVNAIASSEKRKKRTIRIAHITDVHIRPEENAPARFRQCLAEVKNHKPDIILNGGDSIYAADYSHITQERVIEQWSIWDDCLKEMSGIQVYSCLGNHDMWWAAPDKQHEMYGKNYVVKRLSIPARYYSFDKNDWHFIILDSNNENAGSLDAEQRVWLEKDLADQPAGKPILIMSHYPLFAACTHMDGGGMHTDFRYLVNLFYQHKDKVKACISGHIHLQDHVVYNDVQYFCNGAMSGFWWEPGDKNSAAKYYCQQTPPGYAIIDLFNDGSVENNYHPHRF